MKTLYINEYYALHYELVESALKSAELAISEGKFSEAKAAILSVPELDTSEPFAFETPPHHTRTPIALNGNAYGAVAIQ